MRAYNKIERPDFTPDRITQLQPDEVFVFGSNLAGMHGGGAARIAYDAFGAIWGQGKYVETTFRNHIFLSHSLLDTKKISLSTATNRAQELLVMMEGVRNVYTSLQLLTISNEQIQLVRGGYYPERCGDLVIETAPGWRVLTENTGESEYLRASFFQFPIIFYGANVEAMRESQPVTTDRIAPTLARMMRVRAPNACSAKPLF